MPTITNLSVGRIVHAYVHRGLERYGPIAALVVGITRYGEIELQLFPSESMAWITNGKEVVSPTPGKADDQTIPQYVTWEWPPRS